MKLGTLVKCRYQPRCRISNNKVVTMEYFIKNEIGITIGKNGKNFLVMFPQFNGYTHELSLKVLEKLTVIREKNE